MESLEIFNMLKSLARASFKILKNIEQYLNPYLIFKEVFKEQTLSQIEFDIQDIKEHALGNASSCPSENIFVFHLSILIDC